MMRLTSGGNPCRGLVQAFHAYQENAVDTSLMLEGESLEGYVNRLYRFAVWRTIMLAGLTDWAVYKANDMLIAAGLDTEEDREAMMRHYHFYEDRLLLLTQAPEDYIADIRLKAYQRHNRKMTALLNGLEKENRRKDVPQPEVCAMLSLFLNTVELDKKCYSTSVKPLGGVLKKELPTHVADALRRLDRSADAACRVLAKIDPTRRMGECEPNKRLTALAESLLLSIVSPEEMTKAANYANKELKKGEKI